MQTDPYQFVIKLTNQDQALALKAQLLMAQSFRRRLNAHPNTIKRHYLTVERRGEHAELVACSSIAFAQEQKLFSEYYLDLPVEEALERHLQIKCDRSDICEIGGLSTNGKVISAVKLIVAYFPWYASHLGFKYSLVTVTSYMRKALADAGVAFYPLAKAELNRLPQSEQALWGRYYDFDPETGILDLRSLSFLNAFVKPSATSPETQIQLGCFGRVDACS